jgi:hypothetical protein
VESGSCCTLAYTDLLDRSTDSPLPVVDLRAVGLVGSVVGSHVTTVVTRPMRLAPFSARHRASPCAVRHAADLGYLGCYFDHYKLNYIIKNYIIRK